MRLEFRYGRQQTQALVESDELFGVPTPAFDLTVQHLLGGILWEIRGGRFRPSAVAPVGAAGFGPEPEDLVTEWRFAAGLGGGIKVYLSEHVGVRALSRGPGPGGRGRAGR